MVQMLMLKAVLVLALVPLVRPQAVPLGLPYSPTPCARPRPKKTKERNRPKTGLGSERERSGHDNIKKPERDEVKQAKTTHGCVVYNSQTRK